MRGLLFFMFMGAFLWAAGTFFTSGRSLSDISVGDFRLPDVSLPEWSLPDITVRSPDDADPATPTFASDPIRVSVAGVFLAPASMAPVVILEDESATRSLTIYIGYAEADAIRRRLEGQTSPRPMTHDLLSEVVRAFKGTVESVIVTDMADGTYFARVTMTAGDRRVVLDARPSDAIAIAMVEDIPVFVERAVMDQWGEDLAADLTDARDVGCGLSCQMLDPELAVALDVTTGVLIADLSDAQNEAGLLARGDVLLKVGGEPATDVDRVAELLSALGDGDSLPLAVHRDGRQLEVIFHCR